MRVGRLGAVAYRLRGFATNIGGYQPLGKTCPLDLATPMATYCRAHPRDPCCLDSCGMVQRFNSGVGELNFVKLLERHLSLAIPGLEPRFLIDTGRNGAELSGAACVASCNLRTASFGPLPTANTDHGSVDAYLWLLPPGLSDGCSSCPHGDAACSREDAAFGAGSKEPSAPHKGNLYPAFLRVIAGNSVARLHDSAAAMSDDDLKKAAAAAEVLAESAGIPLPNGEEWSYSMVATICLAIAMLLLAAREFIIAAAIASVR